MPIRLVQEPTILVMADMQLRESAFGELVAWLKDTDPSCLSVDEEDELPIDRIYPHNQVVSLPGQDEYRALTDNELYAELAGRGCYRSYGKKAGHKENDEYLANLFGTPGKIPHSSVLYHAKCSFFFGGLSRRVSHELIRHYVGADRSEEGSPSQESTRFTQHPGHFAVHPRDAADPDELLHFERDMKEAYTNYQAYLARQIEGYRAVHGHAPKGMDRKRIYEAAAMRLPGAACTSFFWTTNTEALEKLFKERCDFAADLEIQRFALKLRDLCYREWPNLFRASNPAYQRTLEEARQREEEARAEALHQAHVEGVQQGLQRAIRSPTSAPAGLHADD
jgi:thymidylate synthase (FAD)